MNASRSAWRAHVIAGLYSVSAEIAAGDVRQLVVLARVEIVEEDVRRSGAIGDVRDRLAVGRPLRVQVQARLPRQHRDRARRDVEQRDAPRLESQSVEARAVAIAGERDRLAVGRPLRLEIAEPVVRSAGADRVPSALTI